MDFLKAITASEACRILDTFSLSPRTETVHIDNAYARVLARDIVSSESIPAFARSLVDGYAVRSRDTQGATETNPLFLIRTGAVRIGEQAEGRISGGDCVYVSTGSMMPSGSNAVVMQEYARQVTDGVEITRTVYEGEHVCHEGEDIKEGVIVLEMGRKLTAFDLGVLAALGQSSIPVYERPGIALISTGDEIVAVDEIPSPGKVRDINRYTVTALVEKTGARCEFLGHVADEIGEITEKLQSAGAYDMILISGGSSKGERDFITDSIEKLGGEILFHGINIKPGKPTIFGRLLEKPIFGLPGHPASCAMVAVRFVAPLATRLQGETRGQEITTQGVLATNVPSSYGIEEYVPVRLERAAAGVSVVPIFSKSAVVSSLAHAAGYIIVPQGTEGLEKGETVEVYFF